ncbi:MBL fold metallo-hydrolase [Halosolutus halophilus]|uniref:MBL fold metallo-hydrolase n=1 Tax=Halosolutus halophilus TaxID=1552990 RepID=UPI002234FC7A|nr:MBL fold metallo-hydrolase [Halosolutus halophilus]
MDLICGREVAEGVYRFGTSRINWYVVEEGDALTVVDAGLPGHWQLLVEGIERLGYTLGDVAAILITHGDLDHVGFAEWLRQAADAPVWIHPADVQRANTVSRSLPPIGFLKELWRPSAFAYFVEVVRSGVGSVPQLTAFEIFEDGDDLDVPGHPTVIHLPGHTAGSSAFYLSDRDVLFCGDALMTYNVRTGRHTEPTVLPPIHYDAEKARSSIRKLDSCGEVVLLSGHGEPWRGDVSDIV